MVPVGQNQPPAFWFFLKHFMMLAMAGGIGRVVFSRSCKFAGCVATCAVIVLYAAAIPLLHASAVASDDVALAGYGTAPCESYIQAHDMNADYFDDVFLYWAQGYMSALNISLHQRRLTTTDLGKRTEEAKKQQLYEYCRSNPDRHFYEAVDDLYDGRRRSQGLPDWR